MTDALASMFPYPSQRMPVYARNVVAASQPLASYAGLSMLRRGGNAADAALAAAIALTVVEPTSNGLGSDAFAILWDPRTKQLHGLNASGRSPAAWSPARFAHLNEMPMDGWDSVTVPGAVDGWVQLSERFGRMPFEELFEPAIGYAREGFHVSPITALAWQRAARMKRYAASEEWNRTFLNTGTGNAPAVGELFRLPCHARTLREIAETDGESFYRGGLAQQMIADSQAHGGCMTLDDLANHTSEWVAPISQPIAAHPAHDANDLLRLHEIPPNGQGLAALIALGILHHVRPQLTEFTVDSVEAVHLQIEAMKLALNDLAGHLADIRFMRRTVEDLLDDGRLKALASKITLERVLNVNGDVPTDHGTVCLAAADASGMMVSFIQSNYYGFGSGVVVGNTGITMQNRGAGFTLTPGHANEVGGGKRPYHTIIPGFVTAREQATGAVRPVMAFGVMGGHMQAQGHVQMVVRTQVFGQNVQAACDAPRWHINKGDQRIGLESGWNDAMRQALRERGHDLIEPDEPVQPYFGGAQLIARLPGDGPIGYVSGSDHRKDGCAAGY